MAERLSPYIPVRIAVTNHCNLQCFFCSNEGMEPTDKNNTNADLGKFAFLLEVLRKGGYSRLSITGGEPTCHPRLPALLDLVREGGFSQTFFHTNGIALRRQTIDTGLKDFTKLAISTHSADFETWNRMTRGTRSQFDRLMENLSYLSQTKGCPPVEIKCVVVKGLTNSLVNIQGILELCARNQFKFKFLNFEPITPEQREL